MLNLMAVCIDGQGFMSVCDASPDGLCALVGDSYRGVMIVDMAVRVDGHQSGCCLKIVCNASCDSLCASMVDQSG